MKTLTVNRKVFHDYEILEKFEAGLVLTGSEVKSICDGRVNLKDSYVEIRQGEAFLVRAHISPYPNASYNNHEPERERKLLLNRREIHKIDQKVKARGVTVVPLQMYFAQRGKIKLEIAIAKGKRAYEKKQKIKEKDIQREMERELRHFRKK
jgi:SsrA-binding protein